MDEKGFLIGVLSKMKRLFSKTALRRESYGTSYSMAIVSGLPL
jgi:hypothetical protein